MLANGETIGIPLKELANVEPNGGVTALMAVKSMKAGTAFLIPLPIEPPTWEPAQSPVPLNTPSLLILAINFWLRRLTVFFRLATIS